MHEIAITSLLNSRIKGTFEKEKELLSRLLDRIARGELILPPPEEVERFLTWILYKMRTQRRAYDAHRMLGVMETRLLDTDSPSEIQLPIACFNHVLQALFQAGAVNKVEELFARLLAYYQSGKDHLMPTTASFNIYMTCLARSQRKEGAEQVEAVLEQMIDIHQASGR